MFAYFINYILLSDFLWVSMHFNIFINFLFLKILEMSHGTMGV